MSETAQTGDTTGSSDLGGWLILILIGLILTPIGLVLSWILDSHRLVELKTLSSLQTFFVVLGLGVQLVLPAAAVQVLILMTQLRRTFPAACIALTWANVLFGLATPIAGAYVFGSLLLAPSPPVVENDHTFIVFRFSFDTSEPILFQTHPMNLFLGVIMGLIWTAYLLNSKSVIRTFIY